MNVGVLSFAVVACALLGVCLGQFRQQWNRFRTDGNSAELPQGFSFIGGTTIRRSSTNTGNIVNRRHFQPVNAGFRTTNTKRTRMGRRNRNDDDSDDDNRVQLNRRRTRIRWSGRNNNDDSDDNRVQLNRRRTRMRWSGRNNNDDSDDNRRIMIRRRQRPFRRTMPNFLVTRRQFRRPITNNRLRQTGTRRFRQRPRFTFQRVNTWSLHR